MMITPADEFDRQVRSHIYTVTVSRGTPPLLTEASAALNVTREEAHSSFNRLAAAHMLVLQRDSGEILMAGPFSAVPTPFVVETEDYTCYGNCIWDALGIPAMLNKNARLKMACGDCGTAMELQIVDGKVSGSAGLIHFALPAGQWWEDIVFT